MEKLEMKGLELEYSEELNNLKYEIINEYNQGEQPEREQEYNQEEQPEREQEYNQEEQPETEQEYNQEEQPEREQEYNQGEQPETEQEYNQGEQPEREQEYNQGEQPETEEYNHNGQSEKKMYRWVVLDPYKKYNVCANPLAKSMGSKTFEWHVETYYTANPKARPHFNIHKTASPVPGVHIAEIKQWWDGTVRDKDGYIVLACNGFKFGTIIMTSLWPGKVYDRWWMKRKNHIDIFTNR